MNDRRKPIEPFRFKYVDPPEKPKQPIIRLKPSYYQLLERLKRETRLPLGNIVEYALENLEKEVTPDE